MKEQFLSILRKIPDASRYLIAVAAILGISLLFPNHQRFNYEFEAGQPWNYQDVYAPFDFAILKEQAEIEQQLDSLKQTLEPYYLFDEAVLKAAIDTFTTQFRSKLEAETRSNQYNDVAANAETYLNLGIEQLNRIYEQGVVKLAPQDSGKDRSETINIVRDKEILKQPIRNFKTRSQVLSNLSDTLIKKSLEDVDFLFSLLKENSVLRANIQYSDSLTVSFHEQTLNGFSKGRGMVREGERIVSKKENISDRTYQKLISLKEAYEQKSIHNSNMFWIRLGYFILTSFIILLYILFLQQHVPKAFASLRQLLFLLIWIVVYSFIVYWIESTQLISLYAIPFCIVPIVIRNFYTNRLAFFTHVMVVLCASFITSLGYEFTFTQILLGIVVIIASVKTRYWTSFFFSIVYIFVSYILIFFSLSLIQEGTWETLPFQTAGWLFLNVFLTLLAYPLVPLLERLFGFTSDITLDELSNLDNPLLKELSMKAPGTLQHSLQVANLSEAAASEVGANALLVKVAALYHDIGKMRQPTFFIENQQGQGNPHDNLKPLESAKVIIEHVTEGARMAKKAGLPNVLIDFILTHHGTTRVEYFYRKHLEENLDEETDPAIFCYPGPPPSSKEQVIMMLADSIEAASKSLKSPTEQAINELVDKITAGKISQNQFAKADITFEELEKIKAVYKRLLKSIYHVRIEYPEDKK